MQAAKRDHGGAAAHLYPEEIKKINRVMKEAAVTAEEYAEAKTIVDAVEAAVGVLKAAILMIKWRR